MVFKMIKRYRPVCIVFSSLLAKEIHNLMTFTEKDLLMIYKKHKKGKKKKKTVTLYTIIKMLK